VVQRGKDRRGVHFYVDKATVSELDAIAQATQRSRTQVVEMVIAEAYEKSREQGLLDNPQGLFPEPQPAPKARKRKKAKE
tara:strand:- start:397 stop:636 length:240 start_codon:yes stop_codon:yes gene_type:complete